MTAHKLHLMRHPHHRASAHCGRHWIQVNWGTPNPERFREVWLNHPARVCEHCAAKAKALKIL